MCREHFGMVNGNTVVTAADLHLVLGRVTFFGAQDEAPHYSSILRRVLFASFKSVLFASFNSDHGHGSSESGFADACPAIDAVRGSW
jgi:hypothetical protein